MMRLLLLAATTLLLVKPSSAVFTVSSPKISALESALFDGWANYLTEYDTIKALFAENVQITACFSPHPCGTVTGFDAAFGDFAQALAEFDEMATPLVTTANMAMWHFAITFQTKRGCKAAATGVALAYFNEDGLVDNYQHFSDNTDGLFACMAQEGENEKDEL